MGRRAPDGLREAAADRFPEDHPTAAAQERRSPHRLQPDRPGRNWIRVAAARPGSEPPTAGPLTRALDNAVVLADSHGDVRQAHKILAGALARSGADTAPQERADAEEFLRELAARLEG